MTTELEALRRVAEAARSLASSAYDGEPGTGQVRVYVGHYRALVAALAAARGEGPPGVREFAELHGMPVPRVGEAPEAPAGPSGERDYYDELSDVLDKHPPGMPGMRR